MLPPPAGGMTNAKAAIFPRCCHIRCHAKIRLRGRVTGRKVILRTGVNRTEPICYRKLAPGRPVRREQFSLRLGHCRGAASLSRLSAPILFNSLHSSSFCDRPTGGFQQKRNILSFYFLVVAVVGGVEMVEKPKYPSGTRGFACKTGKMNCYVSVC